MRYDAETTIKLIADYQAGMTAQDIAIALTLSLSEAKTKEDTAAGIEEHLCGLGSEVVPERSVIAKLSSLGVYKKKEYLTKRGEVPVKKEEYIERIAGLLEVSSDILESLEKVNKNVLMLLVTKLDAVEGSRRKTDTCKHCAWPISALWP